VCDGIEFVNHKFADATDTLEKRSAIMVDVSSANWQELLSARLQFLVMQKQQLTQELRLIDKELKSIKKIARPPATKPRAKRAVKDPMLDKIIELLGDGMQRKRVNLIDELQSVGFSEVSQDVTALTRLLKKAVAAGQISMEGRHYSLPSSETSRIETAEPMRQAS
jgi:hypothetical protein